MGAGRLVAAREHFDAAVDHIARSCPKAPAAKPGCRAAFERLLDRISALELLALREADGLDGDASPSRPRSTNC